MVPTFRFAIGAALVFASSTRFATSRFVKQCRSGWRRADVVACGKDDRVGVGHPQSGQRDRGDGHGPAFQRFEKGIFPSYQRPTTPNGRTAEELPANRDGHQGKRWNTGNASSMDIKTSIRPEATYRGEPTHRARRAASARGRSVLGSSAERPIRRTLARRFDRSRAPARFLLSRA
jgi:hypothetical protein